MFYRLIIKSFFVVKLQNIHQDLILRCENFLLFLCDSKLICIAANTSKHTIN